MNNFLRRIWKKIQLPSPETRPFSALFNEFKEILAMNNKVLELIADTNDKLGGDYVFDQQYIRTASREISDLVEKMVFTLDNLAQHRFAELHEVFVRIRQEIEEELQQQKQKISTVFVMPYAQINRDDADEVGGKNANLAVLANVFHLRVPRGIAITASAFQAVLEFNGLQPLLSEILADLRAGKCLATAAATLIQERLLACTLPNKLQRDLHGALADVGATGRWALRSSALGEDSVHSFAGQYSSIINVRAEDIDQAYLRVLASLYNESALVYRQAVGFEEQEAAMPVACQEMIDAQVSGVMYTFDPRGQQRETLLIDATWGLGGMLVAGEMRADHFVVSRSNPEDIFSMEIACKKRALRPLADGGTGVEEVAAQKRDVPCLNNGQIAAIARAGLALEQYFKKPQDIEFALDQAGELVILQARPLTIRAAAATRPAELADRTQQFPVLFRDAGEVAQQGIALGPVYLAHGQQDLDGFPDGAILVVQYTSPLYARVLPRAAGLITAVGSATGHLATIARELGVPAMVNCGAAIAQLAQGMAITMDAEENVVYAGLVRELQYYSLSQEPLAETSEYRLLRRVLRKIEPLHLLDPADSNFVPRACTSLHDITRYVHEKAAETLVEFHYANRHLPGAETGRLIWHIPLELVLIDVGGGIRPGTGRRVPIEAVTSEPMRMVLQGIATPGVWDNEPMAFDFSSFMSSMGRTVSPELASPQHFARNLAVISAEYANISMRLGYHFSMIDAYVSDNLNDNSVYFRFFGGVADERRRTRRARFISTILADLDFLVDQQGDFVVARIKKLDRQGIKRRLQVLGVLIAYCRQLDVRLVSDASIKENVAKFTHFMEAGYEENQHTDS